MGTGPGERVFLDLIHQAEGISLSLSAFTPEVRVSFSHSIGLLGPKLKVVFRIHLF